MEQATCRFACQLASAVEVGGGGTLGFALGPRALKLGCSAGGLVTHFMVCSVQLQSVSEGAAEVSEDRWVWGHSGSCRLQGSMWVLGLPPSRLVLVGKRPGGFAPGPRA